MSNGVLIFAEYSEGNFKKLTYELLSAACKIASQTGEEVGAVLLGKGVSSLAGKLGEYGADKVYLADNDQLAQYTTDSYSKVLVDVIKIYQPSVVILGYTALGRDLAARVAQKIETGLITDCTSLEVTNKDKLTFIRPIYGGKAYAKVICPEARPVMVTIRPNVFSPNQPQPGRLAEVVNVPVFLDSSNLRQVIKDVIKRASSRPELTEADIIVSGGRGLKGPENFKLLEELADVLGAAVGASRAAVDSGWIDHSFQVGQTGKTVSPKLYIACGISGSTMHLAGMSSSKCIVAINNDPEANIFKVADYGIVGDLFEVVPLLIKECKKLLSS